MDKRIRPIGALESIGTSMGVAVLVGIGAFGLLFFLGEWTFLQAFFGGFVVLAVLAVLLPLTVGRTVRKETEAKGGRDVRLPGADIDPALLRPRNVNAPSPMRAAIGASGLSDTTGPDLNAGEVNRAGGTAKPPVGLVSPSSAPTAAVATKPAAPTPKAEPKPAATAAAPVSEGEGTKPATLDAPRGGNADDLKRIKGIGPKLETLCNTLGFWHFEQIAGWSADEVAWVDQNLEGFKGRVTRDEWVSQAKLLAAGEDTAFSKKVDKGGVY
ncbi:MAG: hypothetical protein WBA67_07690 [Jannaschia sp.]